jgi:hypothetical protein
MGTLSFGIKMDGTKAVANDLQRILDLQKQLAASGSKSILTGIKAGMIAKSPDLLRELTELHSKASSQGIRKTLKDFPNAPVLQSNAFFGHGAKKLMGMGALFPPGSQGVPPIIGSGGVKWGQFIASALVGMVSPYIGARGISGAIGGGGSGGSGGAGIFGGGGFPAFQAAFIALTAVSNGLRMAFEQLINSVKRGAELYQSSAAIGHDPSKVAQLHGLAGLIGIPSGQLDSLLLRGEYPLKGGGRQGKLSDALLSSGRGTLQTGELQQIQNMAPYIDLWASRMRVLSDTMGANAKAAKDVDSNFYMLTQTWAASMSTIVADIGPELIVFIDMFSHYLKTLANGFHALMQLPELQIITALAKKYIQVSNLVPENVPEFKHNMLGNTGSTRSLSGWEKIGFNIGGFGGNDHARITAKNTGKTVELLGVVVDTLLLKKVSTGTMFNMP